MRRLIVFLMAAVLLGSAAACTEQTRQSAPPAGRDSGVAVVTPEAGDRQRTGDAPSARLQSAAPLFTEARSAAEVVKAVRPSVVRIRAGGQQVSVFGTVQRNEGAGTGFIVDARGYIVTNNHVVTLGTDRPASRLDVDLWDGRTVQGTLVGRDERTDLAVVKIDAGNLTPLRFADSTQIAIGEEVLAIGFALDLGETPTVTKGVVSAKDRVIEETINAGGRPLRVSIGGAIQTDAPINPGNSGGPLVNLRGEVVGVNTAGLVGGMGQPVQGIFFAVSAQVAEPIVRALMEEGKVERGYLGVTPVTINREMARANNLRVEYGAGLQTVEPGTPADRAGLRPGDVITKVGDHPVRNVGDLTNALTKYRPGQRVRVEYVRGRDTDSVELTVSERPASAQ